MIGSAAAPRVPQLPDGQLPLQLEPDREEEHRHQPAVDPAAQAHREHVPAEGQPERRPPQAVVGADEGRVRPDERHRCRGDEEDAAGGLGLEEAPGRSCGQARQARERHRSPGPASGQGHRPAWPAGPISMPRPRRSVVGERGVEARLGPGRADHRLERHPTAADRSRRRAAGADYCLRSRVCREAWSAARGTAPYD